MGPDIKTQTRFYRRGIVLGLSMAEIVILVIFALLLALASIVRHKDEHIASLTRTLATKEGQLAAVNDTLQALLPQGGVNNFDDLFRELHLVRQEAAEARQRVAALEEQAQSVEEIVEQLHAAEIAEAPLEAKAAWVNEQLRLAEEVLRSVQEAGGEPRNPQTMLADVEKLLASLQALRTALAHGGYEADSMEQFVTRTLTGLRHAEARNATLQGQLRNLQRVCKGTEMPACWASPETGKPEYIFDVALTSTGIIVRDNALPHRREEQRQLPLQTLAFDRELPLARFLSAALPLLEWSNARACRFFVRVFDRTQSHEKHLYKHHLRTVGERFYYYEVLSAPF
jgi:hypothetical protein